MISESTLNALEPIMDLLYADRVTIAPFPRSVIGAVMAASKSSAFDMGNDSKDSFVNAWIADMRVDPLGNTGTIDIDGTQQIAKSLHTNTINEAACAICDATLEAVTNARSKIIPTINNMIGSIDSKVNNAYRPVEEWEIIEGGFLSLWKTRIAKDIVSKADIGDGRIPTLRVNADYPMVPMPTDKSLSEVLMSGNKELDREFRETLQNIGMNVEDLFLTIFGGNGVVGTTRHPIEMRNLALCQLLLVYMIEENPWTGCGQTSSGWAAMCAKLKTALSRAVAIYCNMAKLNKANKTMVVDIDYKKHRIYVESEVYSDWLDANSHNSPEMLIGLAMLEESTTFSADKASTKAVQALNAWQSYHASKQQAVESNRLSLMRTAILEEVATYLQTIAPSDLAPSATRGSIITDVTERMRNATLATVDNLPQLMIDIVCNDVFPHTGLYNIASRFNQIMSAEPNLSPEDAELKVVIEYITDFSSAQLLIGKM